MSGNVGVTGSTADILRSLTALQSLIDNSIADVRQSRDTQHPEIFAAAKFAEEIAAAATLHATSHGLTLKVIAVDDGARILGDNRNLAAAINNLLQNAYKFTRDGSTVTFRTTASVDRICIEVQDECGGLPAGASAELFHPFEQRDSNRTGLGLGLAYSQWAIVANGGRLHVRDLPSSGCVLTVDLPRYVHKSNEVALANVST